MPKHPAIRPPFTRFVTLRLSNGAALDDVPGRVSRRPDEPGGELATQPALRVAVVTPDLPAGVSVEEIEIGGIDYTVLDFERRSAAIGAILDWDRSTYFLRIQ